MSLFFLQVECSPLCEIVWLKDGVAINEDDERYIIQSGEKPPNPAKNDFESVYSSLHFNIHRWPGGKLDRIIDNANYTCQSKSWSVTALKESSITDVVSSTTYFRVECKILRFFFIFPYPVLASSSVLFKIYVVEVLAKSHIILPEAVFVRMISYIHLNEDKCLFYAAAKEDNGGRRSTAASFAMICEKFADILHKCT